MKQSNKIIVFLTIFIFSGSLASAFPWTRDFYDQMSHKAQEGTILNAPEGTVTTNGKKYVLNNREDAAKIKNPITNADLERGKARYERFCLVCHGVTGQGDGPVGKKFEAEIMAPTSLTGDYVQGKPDGDIFYTITKGGQIAMPSYGDSITEDDRWHIINYIKQELKNKAGGN